MICNDCHKNSMAQSNVVDKYCHISNTSKRKVLAALTEDRSMTSIAREHNLSVNTVQRILESCSSKFYDKLNICLDGDSNLVIQILIPRFNPDILHYFYKFTPQARAMVKTVTMDLNCYYPSVLLMVIIISNIY